MFWKTPKMRNRQPGFTAAVYMVGLVGIVGFALAAIDAFV